MVQVHPAPWCPNVAMTQCGVIGISAFGRWEVQGVRYLPYHLSFSFIFIHHLHFHPHRATLSSLFFIYVIIMSSFVMQLHMKFSINFSDSQEACGLEYCNCRTRWPCFEQDSGATWFFSSTDAFEFTLVFTPRQEWMLCALKLDLWNI